MAASIPPDAEDGLLFSSLESEEADTIRRIGVNDPTATELTLTSTAMSSLNETEWRRLGEIVAQTKHLQATSMSLWGVSNQLLTGYFAGLQLNRSIEMLCLSGCALAGNSLRQLSPFLEDNGNLVSLTLVACNLDAAALDLLSSSLLERPGNGLRCVDLSSNNLGDVNLDKFVDALSGSKNLMSIDLDNTGIGRRGCVSLARLLSNPHSKLSFLYLRGNSFDDDAVSTLVEPLANNIELVELSLAGNGGISKDGWKMLLELVSNTSSIEDVVESNHYLEDLGLYLDEDKAAVEKALGVDDSNLLRASLEVNGLCLRRYIIKRKLIWAHDRDDLNIGESPIANDARVLPRILALFSIDSNETDDDCIRCRDLPFPDEKVGAIRLGSLFRIVRSRPNELCSYACHSNKKATGADGGIHERGPLTKRSRD